MVKQIALFLMITISIGCQHAPDKKTSKLTTAAPKEADNKTFRAEEHLDTVKKFKVDPGEKLLYQDKSMASFIDAKRRGTGVISFQLDVNDRLDIFNEDGTPFGDIVLNEDMTYYTLDMPEKVVARKVVPNSDFAAFDFDAEPVKSEDEYLRIYVNKKLRKVKKAGTKYTFTNWAQYSKDENDTSDGVED